MHLRTSALFFLWTASLSFCAVNAYAQQRRPLTPEQTKELVAKRESIEK
jgi:hypothetical protein